MNRFLLLALLLTVAATSPVTAGKYNKTLDIGKPAPPWKNLTGVDGKEHSLADLKDKEVIVVVFTCNSCPYAVDYEDRIIEFAKRHCGEKSKAALIAINVNKIKADSLPEMKKRAEKKSFPFPYLFDETQKIAQDYGATFTPEFFVLNKQREVVYMGGMDDSSDASKVEKHFLVDALKATLAGKQVKESETVAIGCGVRYERRRRTRRRPKPKAVPQES